MDLPDKTRGRVSKAVFEDAHRYQVSIWATHRRALEHAFKTGVRHLVIGHSHFTAFLSTPFADLWNTGSLLERDIGSYFIVEEAELATMGGHRPSGSDTSEAVEEHRVVKSRSPLAAHSAFSLLEKTIEFLILVILVPDVHRKTENFLDRVLDATLRVALRWSSREEYMTWKGYRRCPSCGFVWTSLTVLAGVQEWSRCRSIPVLLETFCHSCGRTLSLRVEGREIELASRDTGGIISHVSDGQLAQLKRLPVGHIGDA